MISREQLPGLADERLALRVLVRAGGLADEGHVRVDGADAEDRLRPRREQSGQRSHFATSAASTVSSRRRSASGSGGGAAASTGAAGAGAIVSGSPRGTKSTPAARSASR